MNEDTEKLFEDLLKTEEGREAIFNILSTSMYYKDSYTKPHNPFVKPLGKESLDSQEIRKLLFANINKFEELIASLYTFEGSIGHVTDDLTSEVK